MRTPPYAEAEKPMSRYPDFRLAKRGAGRTAAGLLAGALLIVAATGLVFALKPVAPVLGLGVVYLLAVLPAAVVWGLPVALPVSVASMLVYNFFFLPPVHTLRLREGENWVAL